MNSKSNIILVGILVTLFCVFCFLMGLSLNHDKVENLNKQIELLECYKENYLIMADSIQNIHVKCFKIGE